MCSRNIYLSIVFCFCLQSFHAQFFNLPADYAFSLLTQRELANRDSATHASIQPYIQFFSNKYQFVRDSHIVFTSRNNRAMNMLFRKHFLTVEPKKEKFSLRLDPLLNLEAGKDVADTSGSRLYTNTRGFVASGNIGERFYFETMVSENQSFFPKYISQEAIRTEVVPGQARWKSFKTSGFDYAFATGFVSIQALKNFNIQIGHGKHKIGNGYRSLLLSDNTFNYPYARFTQQWFKGRVQYSNLYASFMNLVAASSTVPTNTERLFQKKSAAFQYLSVNVSKSINLSFFQGVIWQAGDSRNRQSLDFRYFNPIIYSQLVHFGLTNPNNVLIGADMLVKISRKISVYGQVMADDIQNKKTGFQGGLKMFDVFGVRNFFFQAEYNKVGEGSYQQPDSVSVSQAYSHYNQNIAYTPGQGNELLFITDYKYKRFFVHARLNYQDHFYDRNLVSTVQIVQAKVGYVINPAYNLNVALGVSSRSQNFSNFAHLNSRSNYIYVAFRTSLYNLYYDF
jgi:hypothetical protein